MTTEIQTTATDVVAKALAGPWQAVLLDLNGYSITLAEALEGDVVIEAGVAIVRATAVPYALGHPIPDGHNVQDVIYLSVYGDDSTDDAAWLTATWTQVQAMAAGLNAAAQTGGSR